MCDKLRNYSCFQMNRTAQFRYKKVNFVVQPSILLDECLLTLKYVNVIMSYIYDMLPFYVNYPIHAVHIN